MVGVRGRTGSCGVWREWWFLGCICSCRVSHLDYIQLLPQTFRQGTSGPPAVIVWDLSLVLTRLAAFAFPLGPETAGLSRRSSHRSGCSRGLASEGREDRCWLDRGR